MLWIIPLIMLIFFFCVYIYLVYTQKINNLLIKKQKYLRVKINKKNKLSNWTKVSLVTCLLLFFITSFMFVTPHTNGYIKSVSKVENNNYLIDNYFEKKENRYQEVIDNASSIETIDNNQKVVELGKRIVFIDDDILVSKIIDGEENRIKLEDDIASKKPKFAIVKNYVLIYYSFNISEDYTSLIRIYDINSLEEIEVIKVDGLVNNLVVIKNKISLIVDTKLYNEDNSPILKFNNNNIDYSLSIDDVYYIENIKFYKNLTIISINLENYSADFKSIYVGDCYSIVENETLYIALESMEDTNKEKSVVLRYDITIGFMFSKTILDGYIYKKPAITFGNLKVETVENVGESKKFHLYTFTTFLWKLSEDIVITDVDSKEVALKISDQDILVSKKDNSIILKARNLLEATDELLINLDSQKYFVLDKHLLICSFIDSTFEFEVYSVDNGKFTLEISSKYNVKIDPLRVEIIKNKYGYYILAQGQSSIGVINVNSNSLEFTDYFYSVDGEYTAFIMNEYLIVKVNNEYSYKKIILGEGYI